MQADPNRFKIVYNPGVAEILAKLKSVIAISTYQAGKVIFIGSHNGKKLFQIPVSFKKPMGIALLENKLAVATLDEIQIYSNSPTLAELFPDSEQTYDALYLPRATYYCGDTDLHDLGFGKGGLWAVNTRFSCLSSYDINYSFIPRWKPPFISELTPDDRCHLNGMAMLDSIPLYVTALGKTNAAGAWRENITNGGVLMNVPEGEIILDHLAMPHSPRLINNELYLLLSATGEIIKVDIENKNYKVITKLNRFIRGMTHHENYLFVAYSKIRKTSKTFNKLPVAEIADEAGVAVIELSSGHVVGEIKYLDTVEEIYDVQILPNTVKPGMITPDDPRHKLTVTTPSISFWKKKKKEEDND